MDLLLATRFRVSPREVREWSRELVDRALQPHCLEAEHSEKVAARLEDEARQREIMRGRGG